MELENMVGKRFKVYDNIIEVYDIKGDNVYYLTYKKGEKEKIKGQSDINYFAKGVLNLLESNEIV